MGDNGANKSSWEDQAGDGGLNPTAASFSFNPTTTAFVPGGAQPVPPPVPPTVPPAVPPTVPPAVPPTAPPTVPPTAPPPVPPPPSANDLAAELAAMAAIARGEKKVEETKAQVNTTNTANTASNTVDKPKKTQEPKGEQVPVPVPPAYTPEERAARKEKIAATLAEIDAEDARQHMNVVFIGHVDAGKSTTAGQILFLTGGVDDRTIEKYEREAKEKNRESWYMAYIMDTNEEERAKGKTVEVGRAHFETDKKRYTILDAPGHKSFVPNMISGASQADIGVLVISARKGEFETGFERGGQTREHAQLAKTLGVSKLVVAVNKMDDPSIVGPGDAWSKPRYDEIVSKLTPFLRGCGYKPSDLVYVPISGLMGKNMKEKIGADACSWYDGAPLFEILDGIEPSSRDPYAPFRMPVMDKYKDMGTIVMGKCESGIVKRGDKLTMMPNKVPVKVTTVWRDEVEVEAARPGENLRLRLSGIDEEEVSSGFVLSDEKDLVPVVHSFEAQIAVLDLLEHKPILTGGYTAILHLHSIVEECEVTKMVWALDPKTREKKKTKFVKSNSVCAVRIKVSDKVCLESFADNPQLGRFTLRDEGRTIAIGKVLRLPKG